MNACFFVKTPNALSIDEIPGESATLSPWIYSELSISQIVCHKLLAEYRDIPSDEYIAENGTDMEWDYQMQYRVRTNHLRRLSMDNLVEWANELSLKCHMYPMDKLYEQQGIFEENNNFMNE